MYNSYASHYLAHQITLDGLSDEAFAKSLSAARVDMNPHQVEAALFALKSPLKRGVILADEVGLGKTIEASMVIAQRWSEQKRHIALIAPASLRKQWQQELIEKFSLPSTIIDAKVFRDMKKRGVHRPLHDAKGVVIMSYEFAALRPDDVAAVPWDLVVFDEAHRLRNVYKKEGSVRAKALRDALRSPFKMLLTATPLQNSLMELYGLVSVIDDKHFGGDASFRSQYATANVTPAALESLKERLKPVCHRTLRRQVQEAGHINYTARQPVTFNFDPTEEERELYTKVSTFLQRKDTISYGERANALVILQVRKVLGSSTFAVKAYLRTLIRRLENRETIDTSMTDDIDDFDEIEEEFGEEGGAPNPAPEYVDPVRLQHEIDELKGFLALAESIGRNAKGDELVRRLPEALDQIEQKGGRRKAVIFTESVRTQMYLAELFNQNGYKDQVVLLNGSNGDPESRAIYQAWKERHKGTDKISGSKPADMKQALVEAFRRDEKTIFIATESGAEGINLQFCSLLVNFDLPWNPQRVEQRIGRCHRYGQKVDVTVVNMLNLSNAAERRIYELLDEKFRLFNGVFGSSDEILGAIESGVDFERAVLEIVQSARDEEQIQAEFDRLQEKIQDKIDADLEAARAKVLEELDQNVVARLKSRKGALTQTLDEFTRKLLTVARAELPDAHFHEDNHHRFDHDGKTYTTEWPIADSQDWQFFRLADGSLATELVERSKQRKFEGLTQHVVFHPDRYPFDGQLVDVRNLKGRSGWMKVAKARIDTPNAVREQMMLSCVTDDGEVLQPETADRMWLAPSSPARETDAPCPEERLRAIEGEHFAAFSDNVNLENAKWLEQEEERLEAYADDLEAEFKERIRQVEDEIKELRRERRNAALGMEERLSLGKQIKRKEGERDDLVLSQHERRRDIRRQVEDMLDDVAAGLHRKPELLHLFTVRWSVE